MLLESILLGAVGGAISFAGNQIYKKMKPVKEEVYLSEFIKEIRENEIKEKMWEDIWKYNEVRVKYEDEIKVPVLLGTYYLNNGIKYLFRYPIGISSEKMEKCKTQIKELSNSDEVEFTHYKNDMVYVTVTKNMEEEKVEVPKEIADENERWTEFWIKTKKGAGDKENGFEYPVLTGIDDINGDKLYHFKMPIGVSTFHIEQVDISIKEYLGARAIEISSKSKGTMEIKAYFTELPKTVPFKVVPVKDKNFLEVSFGVTRTGYATVNFYKMPHILTAGMTNSGKSTVTKMITAQIVCNYSPDELVICLADHKRCELSDFVCLPHTKRFVEKPDDTEKLIDELIEVMDERYAKFRSVGVKNLYDYNKKVPKKDRLPFILVIMEEIARYTLAKGKKQNGEKSKSEKLTELGFEARGAGVFLDITVQKPTANSLPPDVKSSLGNTIALLTTDSHNSRIICDDGDKLKYLRGFGHGYIQNDLGSEEFQSFWASDEDITNLLKKRGLWIEGRTVNNSYEIF